MSRLQFLRAAAAAAVLVAAFSLATPSRSASLLPNGEQTFVDGNGVPLAGGTVTFYVPNTTVFKNTWKDPNQTVLNSNPVVLNGAGRAIIYGAGVYRQIVRDSLGNLVWDQLTSDGAAGNACSYAGTSAGTPNAQTITAPNFSTTSGSCVTFTAGLTNTSAMTLSVSGSPPIQVVKDTASGPVPLTGGEIATGNIVQVTYDSVSGALHMTAFPQSLSPTFLSVTTQNFIDTGPITLSGAITPGALTVSQNDWNPTGLATAAVIRVAASAPVDITGLTAQAGGRIITLENIGTSAITLTANDANSLAANRFLLPSAQLLPPASGVMLWYDSISAGWRQMRTYPQPGVTQGAFSALKVAVTGDQTLSINAGEILIPSTLNTYDVFRARNISLNVNLGIVGANGLDTGSPTASSWYAVMVIFNPTSGVSAGLLTLTPASPTLPSGFTSATRVGWVRYDAGPKFWRTIQYGAQVQITLGVNPTSAIVLASGASGDPVTPTWSSFPTSVCVPTTASQIRVSFAAQSGSSAIAAPNSSYSGSNASASNPPPFLYNQAGGVGIGASADWLLESPNVFYASNGANAGLFCLGWEDNL